MNAINGVLSHNVYENEQVQDKSQDKTPFVQLNDEGPTKSQYDVLNQYVNTLRHHKNIREATNLTFLKSSDSIMGHIRNKPMGYAGDYLIIDRIYRNLISSKFYLWDIFSLHHPAAKAVCNRKQYFLQCLTKIINSTPKNTTFQLLNVASGPARDLLELYQELEHPDLLLTDCVELDARAIWYAKSLCHDYLSHIHFHQRNILRHSTHKQYHLIWSAGLFDYFNDKTFVYALQKFRKWLLPGGEIVVGNFNEDHNPSRAYMELFGEWFLIHRTEEQLKELALEAGYADCQTSVEREQLNINLFLRIKMPR